MADNLPMEEVNAQVDAAVADENPTIHLPDREYRRLGLTSAVVDTYPSLRNFQDTHGYEFAQFCIRSLIGANGTPLQLKECVDTPGNEFHMFVKAAEFMVLNQVKPKAQDIEVYMLLGQETVNRLADGDVHAVNRRAALLANGTVTGTGVLPVAVRDVMVGW